MAPGAERVVVDLFDDSPDQAPPERPHGKGPAAPKDTSASEGDSGSWGESPLSWRNLDNLEGEARFILNDPSELYFWRGMRETGCSAMCIINQLAELVGHDFFNITQVQ